MELRKSFLRWFAAVLMTVAAVGSAQALTVTNTVSGAGTTLVDFNLSSISDITVSLEDLHLDGSVGRDFEFLAVSIFRKGAPDTFLDGGVAVQAGTISDPVPFSLSSLAAGDYTAKVDYFTPFAGFLQGFGPVFFNSAYKLDVAISATTAPVPVPAAVWMLGSALIGLVGVSRRRVGA
jgi:hypothetical protein